MINSTPDASSALSTLAATIRTLRSDQGCPWDRKQTPKSLKKHVLAECSELIIAIDNDDHDNIMEELGDLLYLLMMLTQMHDEENRFNLCMVIEGITAKLVRRHPHVFAGKPYESDEQLREQWQAIKEQEKKKKSI